MIKALNAVQYLADLVILFLGYQKKDGYLMGLGAVLFLESSICSVRVK
jgi:hypothetical protein